MSKNPCLDGFIAEQYHAQTFNINAEAAGSPYRAYVLEPKGTAYGKNSVDVVIKDAAGKTVRRYQSKYGQDADSTAKLFQSGNYRGQQKLVPGEQATSLRGTTDRIKSPDGITSNPLTKDEAKQLQSTAQSGKNMKLDWNEVSNKQLAMHIGKQTGQAALLGAAVGTGVYIAEKVWNGETIDGEEVVESALKSGADFGVKAAAAGALKVGVEKGIVGVIPKGTPAGILASVAFVAVENVKVMGRVASGELSLQEGLNEMENTTVSTAAGVISSGKGALTGAAIGSIFGPVGAVVGGFIGGTVGYMAGSTISSAVVRTVQKVREKAKDVIVKAGEWVGDRVSSVVGFLSGLFC